MSNVRDDELARRYLLGGTLDSAEREAAEERLLNDGDGFAEVVEAVERDLYDEYVANSLAAAERKLFVQYLESHPDAAERLRFSSALQDRAAKAAAPARRPLDFPRWIGAAAAAVIMIAGGAWYFFFREAAPRAPVVEPEVFAFVLQPGTLRSSAGEKPQAVRIPASAALVSIELAAGSVSAARSARIRFIDSGQEVWRGEVRDGRVRLPASALAAGDHVATTLGETGDELADYVFRIIR